MQDKDFNIWKTNLDHFFVIHRDMFFRIIARNCFCGHLNKHQVESRKMQLFETMKTDPVKNRLNNFRGLSSFLVFFCAVLKDMVITRCQGEDVELLTSDFKQLVMKYRPLIEMVCFRLPEGNSQGDGLSKDMVQQVSANLLEKEASLRKAYNPDFLFRNFFWTVIVNEAKNLRAAELRRQRHHSELTEKMASGLSAGAGQDRKLLIDEAVGLLDAVIRSYFGSRMKLIVCLKAIYGIEISNAELHELLGETVEWQKSLKPDKPASGGMQQRLSLIRPYLNRAENSTTDTGSYWRWTNLQINSIIACLNRNHLMTFTRETFELLAERYFLNYYDHRSPKGK